MSISDLLRKQALAEKEQQAKLKKIEAMEAELKAMKLKASKPVLINPKELAAEKQKNLEKFGAALRKVNEEKRQKPMNDAHAYLSNAGWTRVAHNPEKLSAVYTHKQLPGHQLKIDKNEFSIVKGADVVQSKTPLTKIKSFLPTPPVTQKTPPLKAATVFRKHDRFTFFPNS